VIRFTCADHFERAIEQLAAVSMAAVGEPEENGYTERLMRKSRTTGLARPGIGMAPTPGGSSTGF